MSNFYERHLLAIMALVAIGAPFLLMACFAAKPILQAFFGVSTPDGLSP